jgi:hypothetical protein
MQTRRFALTRAVPSWFIRTRSGYLPDPKSPVAQFRRREEGFVLVSVLVVAILLALLATTLMTAIRVIASESSMFVSDVGARAATEGGLNRIILAFSRSGDALREALIPDGRPAPWDFNGTTLLLRAQAESGKLDVNAADRSHMAALLDVLFHEPGVRSYFLAQIDNARSSGRRIGSLSALLSPLDRMTMRLDLAESHFTVMTSQKGFDPATAPPAIVQTTPELTDAAKKAILAARAGRLPLPLAEISAPAAQKFTAERPIYAFRAETFAGFGRAMAMSAIVGFSDQTEISVYRWAPASMAQ